MKSLRRRRPAGADRRAVSNAPFHLYDEAGIRSTARALKAAFAWNSGFMSISPSRPRPTRRSLRILAEGGLRVTVPA